MTPIEDALRRDEEHLERSSSKTMQESFKEMKIKEEEEVGIRGLNLKFIDLMDLMTKATQASKAATKANETLQRRVLSLTIATVILAVISALFSFIQADYAQREYERNSQSDKAKQ